jgi:23S rRNA pseudouridine1911/1915/1917 synthase
MTASSSSSSDEPRFRGYSYGVRHLEVSATSTLVDFVSRGILREGAELTALELIEMGAVYVNDQRSLSGSRDVETGDRVRVHTRPRRYPQPNDLLSRIVSEDDDVIVVDKPAGLPVHALVDNINENLISYLEDLRGGTLFITHRLDVETSGLVLLAKNPGAQARLNRAFADGSVKRTYAAFTLAPVPVGLHVHYMEPSPRAPKTVSSTPAEGWSHCSLEVLCCDEMVAPTSVISEGRTVWTSQAENSEAPLTLARVYRLEIVLQTGRPQQIRAQLAALGAPIIGDVAYQSPLKLVDESGRSAVALRAIRISL